MERAAEEAGAGEGWATQAKQPVAATTAAQHSAPTPHQHHSRAHCQHQHHLLQQQHHHDHDQAIPSVPLYGVLEVRQLWCYGPGLGQAHCSSAWARPASSLAPLSTITSPATLRTFQCCTINKYTCILLPNYCLSLEVNFSTLFVLVNELTDVQHLDL